MVIVPAYYYTKMLVEQTAPRRLQAMDSDTATQWNALFRDHILVEKCLLNVYVTAMVPRFIPVQGRRCRFLRRKKSSCDVLRGAVEDWLDPDGPVDRDLPRHESVL